MHRYTIDRLEDEGWAVIEDEQSRTLRIPVAWLPVGVTEGDVVAVSNQAGDAGERILRFEVDSADKERRLEQARNLRDGLPPGPKGDVSL